MRTLLEGLVLVGALIAYFLPAIIADARDRQDALALTIFNVLFGWTVIGWIAAFVWARHRVTDKRLSNVATKTRRGIGRATIARIVARSRRVRIKRRESTFSVF